MASTETEDIRFSFFQQKSFYENSYPFSSKEDLCFQLIRSLQTTINNNGKRRRKLGEIGNLENLFNNPPKKVVRDAPLKKSQDAGKTDLINTLPDELLVEIFRFIPGPADRYSCASVCMRWLMLQSHLHSKALKRGDEHDTKLTGAGDELKRNLEGKRATDVRLALVALGTQSRGGLGKLTIKGGPRQNPAKAVSNVGLSAVAICCPNVKILSVWDCAKIGDAGFAWIGKGCSQLKVLNVLNCPGFGDAGLRAIAAGCPQLTSLSLEGCGRISDAGLEAVGTHCTQLSCFSVVGCRNVSDAGIVSVVTCCKMLRAVKVEKVGIRDAGLKAIGEHGHAIQKLKLMQLDQVSCDGFFLFGRNSNMSQLKHLQIAACAGFSESLLQDIGKASKELKYVSVSNCALVQESSLLTLLDECTSLETLHVEKCTIQTLSAAAGESEAPRSLKVLNVVNCAGVKSRLFETVAGLNELDLTGEASLSDEALVALVSRSGASLTRLNITGCTRITDYGVAAVVALCPALTSFTLEECVNVSDQGLQQIAEGGAQVLQELIFSNCFRVTDSGVWALVSAMGPQLKTLSLAGCWCITERSLEWIEQGCQVLEALNLKDCKGISREEVESFESRTWKCQVCY